MSDKPLSKEMQEELGCDENGVRCTLVEISYQDLPKGYRIVGDDLPYVKRPLEQVKFHVWQFCIGNENFVKHLTKFYSEEKARELVDDMILEVSPILTEEEEREQYGGRTLKEMWEDMETERRFRSRR